jgi:UrcA family protein
MSTAKQFNSAWPLLGAAFACTCFVGSVTAKEHVVTISVPVNSQGLDLSRPDDARAFYIRLQNAAWLVCTRGTQVNLVPFDNPSACYEKSLGEAVRSARKPLVTQLYLATHTLQEAAARGIQLPAQVAAK